MKVDEWLNFFKHHKEKNLFSLADFAQLTGENKSSLSVQLTRLVKTGILSRAAQTWYENPFTPPSPEEVAMVIRYPSYLSMEYALSKHGILSQATYTLTLITTKLPYTYRTTHTVYEYHQISHSLFWGYEKEGTVCTADPEKAFLDLIYIRYMNTGELPMEELSSLVDDMAVDGLDLEKLYQYSKQFNPKTRKALTELKI
ncbi:MAG: type IV toxin-antitoxin system AbiEi family antitoxin domain-containing protein [Petrotogales bacterium]